MKTPGVAEIGNHDMEAQKNNTFCAMDYYWLLTGWPLMGDPYCYNAVAAIAVIVFHFTQNACHHRREWSAAKFPSECMALL